MNNKTVTRHSGDKPWVTDLFRSLVRKRQRAHMQGDQADLDTTAPMYKHVDDTTIIVHNPGVN